MSERKLSKLVRLALLPALAASVAMGGAAQTAGDTAGTATGIGAGTAASAAEGRQEQSRKQDARSYRGVRASKMIGMTVRKAKGGTIGQIGDMVVNMKTGDVRYAILRFDPSIVQGEKLFAVPTSELRIAPDRDDLLYAIDDSGWSRAPIDRGDWEDGADNVVAEADLARFDKLWGIARPAHGAQAHRASRLIGEDVETPSGEKIGKVEDLVINMAENKVHYAVLASDPSPASPERNYAFPLRSFQAGVDNNALVLDIDKSQLQAMKSFPESRYANLNDRGWVSDIDRYFVTVLPADTSSTSAAGAAPAFGRLDTDGDGSLTREEAQADARLGSAWQQLDKDDDGRISESEFDSGRGLASPAR